MKECFCRSYISHLYFLATFEQKILRRLIYTTKKSHATKVKTKATLKHASNNK